MNGHFPKTGTLLIAKNPIYNSEIIRYANETNVNIIEVHLLV